MCQKMFGNCPQVFKASEIAGVLPAAILRENAGNLLVFVSDLLCVDFRVLLAFFSKFEITV